MDSGMYEYYSSIKRGQSIEKVFHNKLTDLYNYYMIIGGMPECVYSWITEKDPERIAQIQSELVELYENDFSKHNGSVNSGRILMVFRSIVTQLAKDNEKFLYGVVREGARAREYEEAIEWLVSAGMVIRIYNVSKPEHPLAAFQQLNHFKLFMFDVGLLKHMAGVSNEAVLLKADYQFKVALTENYVLQQIREMYDVEPKYYAPTATKEIDFVLQDGMDIIPAEVKAGESVNAESFKSYIKQYKPEKAVRYSKLGYEITDSFTNIPLYLAGRTKDLV
jgi:predicted AAA+ superfamily ATPase